MFQTSAHHLDVNVNVHTSAHLYFLGHLHVYACSEQPKSDVHQLAGGGEDKSQSPYLHPQPPSNHPVVPLAVSLPRIRTHCDDVVRSPLPLTPTAIRGGVNFPEFVLSPTISFGSPLLLSPSHADHHLQSNVAASIPPAQQV